MAARGGVAAAVLVLLVGCGPGGPRPVADPGAPGVDESATLETVRASGVGEILQLRFDWPGGLVGRCRSRRRVVGDGPAEPAREVTFRVRVERAADEVRVVTEDLGGDENRGDVPGPLVEAVAPDGSYRAAQGVEDAVARRASRTGHGAADTALAVREIEARLAETWKLLVAAWAGRELPLGAAYAATAPETLPGGETLRVRIAIQADGRVPCDRADTARRCVRLRLHSEPEERAPQGLVRELLGVLAPEGRPAPDAFVPDVASITTSAIVVTEPDTLIPHRFVLRRRFALAGAAPGDPAFARERGEEITRVCAWR